GRPLLEGSRVRWAGTATAGTDHLDLAYLRQRGIGFASAPGGNAAAVCEYVGAALLRLAVEQGLSLAGATLGVVGVGRIGSRVARMAEALGMSLLLCDPPRARLEGPERFVPLERLLAGSDFVTLHVPLTGSGSEATWRLAGERFFAALRPGAVLLNTSRGEVVDEAALRRALQQGRVAHAVLDVWEDEPRISPATAALAAIATPHIAGYSLDGKVAATRLVYEAACRALGLPAVRDALPPLPPAPVPELRLDPAGRPAAQVLDEAVRAVYDLRRDDRALRAALQLPPPESASAFGQLRRGYPTRWEFGHTRLALPGQAGELRAAAAGLGFAVAPQETGSGVDGGMLNTPRTSATLWPVAHLEGAHRRPGERERLPGRCTHMAKPRGAKPRPEPGPPVQQAKEVEAMADREELQREMAVLKSELGELREHLLVLTQTMKGMIRAESGEAKEQIEAEAKNLLERFKQALEEVRGRGRRAYTAVEHQIEERPFVALAAAFGIGLLLGKLLDWRS
ncbi:MAG: DUF3410 domain-containing protein, partial [Deltaproteobacteria bacterium]|nr:DUF3410 domain-containing protein [Deltaproteobacteria bacterium]